MSKIKNVQEAHQMQRAIFDRDFADGPFSGVVQNLSYDKRVKMAVKYLKPSDSVICFGCGDGVVTRRVAEHVTSMHAIDISENAIKTAMKYNNAPNITFRVSTIEDFSGDRSFHASTFFEVLEHVFDPLSILKKINGHLCAGGYLFLSTPNFARLTRRVKNLPFIRTIRIRKGKDPNRIGCDHVAEYTFPEVKNMLDKAGFDIVERSGIFLWTNTVGGDLMRNVYCVQFINAQLGACFPDYAGHMYIVARKRKM